MARELLSDIVEDNSNTGVVVMKRSSDWKAVMKLYALFWSKSDKVSLQEFDSGSLLGVGRVHALVFYSGSDASHYGSAVSEVSGAK